MSNFKTGRYFDKYLGYWKVKAPDHPSVKGKLPKHQYVLEHRLVMEAHLGRFLTEDEVVHHKDDNRSNNKIENLELITKAEHNRIHKRVREFITKGGNLQVFTNKKYRVSF